MSQLMYCYAANNRAAKPCRLVMTGISGDCKERFDQIPGQSTWKVGAKPYTLSPSSPTVGRFEGRFGEVVINFPKNLFSWDAQRTLVLERGVLGTLAGGASRAAVHRCVRGSEGPPGTSSSYSILQPSPTPWATARGPRDVRAA